MRNLMDYKTFEAEKYGNTPILSTSEEDLTNYYKCNKCGQVFNLFNDTAETCSSCRSNDIIKISDFDYFTVLKKGDKSLYSEEFKKKQKRSSELVDLVNVAAYTQQRNYRRSLN